MSPSARLAGSAFIVAGVGLAIAGIGLQAGAESLPLDVTTDTPAYCQRLSDQVGQRVRAMDKPPPDAVRLSDEGDRLCDEGQIRGGIMRLRRAWLLMTHPEGSQPVR